VRIDLHGQPASAHADERTNVAASFGWRDIRCVSWFVAPWQSRATGSTVATGDEGALENNFQSAIRALLVGLGRKFVISLNPSKSGDGGNNRHHAGQRDNGE